MKNDGQIHWINGSDQPWFRRACDQQDFRPAKIEGDIFEAYNSRGSTLFGKLETVSCPKCIEVAKVVLGFK